MADEETEDLDEDTLKIDIETPSPVKSRTPPVVIKTDDHLLETIEGEIGKQLTEKAEKTNLTVCNVKSIIRQVLTNEHVLALMHKEDKSNFPEPKLTRAKTKELLSSNPVSLPHPWTPQPPPSETHVLVTEELPEDSSGDEEYVPGDDEEHDENDDSMASESDTSSLPPPTPPSAICMEDSCNNQTSWTEDGIFKIPPTRPSATQENFEEANIALRTRSKINLSSTPLETIEKLFIPPDITTDMYDMECDDEEWKDFLKGFAEPLDVAAKQTEDEDHDPEYNIFAEYDEIEKVDKIDRKEEFRDDKAVTVTKKELKELWEELFEYIQNMSDNYENLDKSDSQLNEFEDTTLLDATGDADDKDTDLDLVVPVRKDHEYNEVKEEQKDLSSASLELTGITLLKNINLKPPQSSKKLPTNKSNQEVLMTHEQICILEQQMRQHIQMLTQNFLLMYEHPEYHNYCSDIKEYLLNFKFLSQGKMFSLFKPVNLEQALKLVDYWRDLFNSNEEEVKQCKLHVQRELAKSLQCSSAGNYNYIPTFPRLILKTITRNEVFLYPGLLPKIPFKSSQFGSKKGFTESEDRLLVFSLDHFSNFLQKQDGINKHKNKHAEIPLTMLVSYTQEYVMPHREKASIFRHIRLSKDQRCADNPIKTYFLKKQLPKIVHYIYPLQTILPPYKRSPFELPTQIRNFLFSDTNTPLCPEKTPTLVQSLQEVRTTPNQPLYLLSSTPIACQNSLLPIKPRASNVLGQLNIEKSDFLVRRRKNQRKDFRNKLHEYGESLKKFNTSIEKFLTILLRPIPLRKLINFCPKKDDHYQDMASQEENVLSALSGQPLNTSNVTITTTNQEPSKQDVVVERKYSHDFSYISSSSFQDANVSTEVEFCKTTNNFQISQVTSQQFKDDISVTSTSVGCGLDTSVQEKGSCSEDITFTNNTTVKQSNKKEKGPQPSGAEKKKAKIKREFLANLSIATPDNPESIKDREEAFAFAFYDNIRETLDLEDYHMIMQILNDFESGDAVDLYRKIEPILAPKYKDLLEEFLLFLREKEAAELGLLIPWIKVNNRAKFLRKIEVFFKDQPVQLKKVYNTLTELSRIKDVTMDKIKSLMLPLLKGNRILTDLFLQNFMCERPPPSLLQGPYETIDIHKGLSRSDKEEMFETIVVPNIEDKYGGQNCICHCHTIEDSFYKSRYKHCTSCGLRFVNGQIFVQSGRSMQPATVSFKTSPKANHGARLLGKPSTGANIHKGQKRKSDSSPNKHSSTAGKENFDEDTDDEDKNKRKSKSAPRRQKRKKPEESAKQNKKEDNKIIAKGEDVKAKVVKGVKTSSKKLYKSKAQGADKKAPKKSINAENEHEQVKQDVVLKPDEPQYSFKGALDVPAIVKPIEPQYSFKGALDVPEIVKPISIVSNPFDNASDEDRPCPLSSITKNVEQPDVGQSNFSLEFLKESEITNFELNGSGESIEKPLTPGQQTAESGSESQDFVYESDSSSSSNTSNIQQSDSNTNDEPPWKREEDTVILETFQQEDDKDYALQIICDKLPNRTISQIRVLRRSDTPTA